MALMTQHFAITSCGDKKIRALIPPRARAGYRAEMYRIKQLFGGHLTLRD